MPLNSPGGSALQCGEGRGLMRLARLVVNIMKLACAATRQMRERRRKLEEILLWKPASARSINLPRLSPSGYTATSFSFTISDGLRWKVVRLSYVILRPSPRRPHYALQPTPIPSVRTSLGLSCAIHWKTEIHTTLKLGGEVIQSGVTGRAVLTL